jgi:HEXXH motif-containing protein
MHCLPNETFSMAQNRLGRLRLGIHACLPDALRECKCSGEALAAQLEAWFRPMAGVAAQEFVRTGTPFFWLNLVECWGAAIHNSPQIDVYVQRLWLAAFDAFFKYLPDGFALEPRTDLQSDIVLPTMGIRIPVSHRPVTLIRHSSSRFGVASAAGMTDVNLLDEETAFPTSTAGIPGYPSQRVLLAQTPALAGEGSEAPVGAGLSAFVEMLGQALKLIDDADPRLAETLRTTIKWYVPIPSDDPTVHRSYTRADLIGVIHLSPALNHVVLAEAVVHEFYHNVLNIVMVTEPLLNAGTDEMFYSPWRNDPRPLYGLFHAIYVFSGVAQFYAAVELVLAPGELCRLAQRKRARLHLQLRVAVAQVREESLSQTGKNILETIGRELDAEKEFDPALSEEARDAVQQHWQTWRRRNPDLAACIRAPA